MIYGPYKARVVSIHDGDTLSLDIDLGFGVILAAQSFTGSPFLRCRLYGINAPELSTPEGVKSRDYLLTLVKPGHLVSVVSHGWDKYGGRFDGEVELPDGTLVNEAMVRGGFAIAKGY